MADTSKSGEYGRYHLCPCMVMVKGKDRFKCSHGEGHLA